MDSLPVDVLQVIANYSGDSAFDIRLTCRLASKCRVLRAEKFNADQKDKILGRTHVHIRPGFIPFGSCFPDITKLEILRIPPNWDWSLFPNVVSLKLNVVYYLEIPSIFPARIKHVSVCIGRNISGDDIPLNIKKMILTRDVSIFDPGQNALEELRFVGNTARIKRAVIPASVKCLHVYCNIITSPLANFSVSHKLKTFVTNTMFYVEGIKAENYIIETKDYRCVNKKLINQSIDYVLLKKVTTFEAEHITLTNSSPILTMNLSYMILTNAKSLDLSNINNAVILHLPCVEELNLTSNNITLQHPMPTSVKTLHIYWTRTQIPDHIENMTVRLGQDPDVPLDYSETKLKNLDINFQITGYYPAIKVPETLRRLRFLYFDDVKIVLTGDKLERYKANNWKIMVSGNDAWPRMSIFRR